MKRYAGLILTLDIVAIFIALFGGWAWVARHFGLIGFTLVPFVTSMLFIWAADNIDTPPLHNVDNHKN